MCPHDQALSFLDLLLILAVPLYLYVASAHPIALVYRRLTLVAELRAYRRRLMGTCATPAGRCWCARMRIGTLDVPVGGAGYGSSAVRVRPPFFRRFKALRIDVVLVVGGRSRLGLNPSNRASQTWTPLSRRGRTGRSPRTSVGSWRRI
jgi:hypothetical protein